MINQFIDTFLQDTARRPVLLRESLTSANMANAALQSHSIKGAAATVSALAIREAAFEMEKACRAGEDAGRVMSMLPSLEHRLKELKLFVAGMASHVAA